MSFTLKGFPTEISDYIELPSIAELILQPIFNFNHIDYVYENATPFQKMILEKTPFRHDKKDIYIFMNTKFLMPNQHNIISTHYWHIDTDKDPFGNPTGVYYEERDRAFILSSDDALPEFNEKEVTLDFDPTQLSMQEMTKYLYKDLNHHGITPKKIPPNRIITFSNHLHRTVPVTKPMFRFLYRAIETDSDYRFAGDKKIHSLGRMDPTGKVEEAFRKEDHQIVIPLAKETKELTEFMEYNHPEKFNTLLIHDSEWMDPYTLKLKHYGNLDEDAFAFFADRVHKEMLLADTETEGAFRLRIESVYLTEDKGAELIVEIPESSRQYLKENHSYVVKFNKKPFYRFDTVGTHEIKSLSQVSS